MILKALTVTALTLNVWGLPNIATKVPSPLRAERIDAICENLASGASKIDVVLLQEVWVQKDREHLKKNCGYAFSFEDENDEKFMDSGLLVLSQIPIDQARSKKIEFHSKPSMSEAAASFDGESMVSKSFLRIRLQPKNHPAFWLINTHLVSFYDIKNDRYPNVRLDQMREILDDVYRNIGNEPLIVGGDLNTGTEFKDWAKWDELMQGFDLGDGLSDPKNCTSCPPNIFSQINNGKIDHLFGKNGFTSQGGKIMFQDRFEIDGVGINVSDHFGWKQTFSLEL